MLKARKVRNESATYVIPLAGLKALPYSMGVKSGISDEAD
jgi:hypothetical protein